MQAVNAFAQAAGAAVYSDAWLVKASPLWEVALVCYCAVVARNLFGVGTSRAADATWLSNAFVGMLAAFAGGIINPLLLGMDSVFPFVMSNDAAIPASIATTLLTCYSPGNVWAKLMALPVLKDLLDLVFELVRARLVCHWAELAMRHVPASYASYAVCAPLLAGFLGGCGGALATKGVAALKADAFGRVPFPVESALFASFLYSALRFNWIGDTIVFVGTNTGLLGAGMAYKPLVAKEAHRIVMFLLVSWRLQRMLARMFEELDHMMNRGDAEATAARAERERGASKPHDE